MAQPQSAMPHPLKPHGLNQQFNQSVFQSTPTRMNDNHSQQSPMNSHSAANKMSSHHSQETQGFYNQGMNYGHQYGSNGAGSSSGMSNNFYMPHYSVSGGASRLNASELIPVFLFFSNRHRNSSSPNRAGTNSSNTSDRQESLRERKN